MFSELEWRNPSTDNGSVSVEREIGIFMLRFVFKNLNTRDCGDYFDGRDYCASSHSYNERTE
jgi:hypothetical protein